MSAHAPVETRESELDSTIRAIAEKLPAKPLAAMDLVIESLRKHRVPSHAKQLNKLLNLFARACIIAFLDAEHAIDCEKPLERLFSPSESSTARRQIAVALARFVAAYPDIQTRPDISTRVIALFDDCFADSLYRMAKIDRGTQAFLKLQEISGLITNLENDLSDMISRITTLQDAAGFRSQYLKKINSSMARLVIHPFLPSVVREERITHCFAQVETYGTSSGPAILDAYTQVQDSTRQLMEAADTVGSQYAQTISKAIAARLVGVVTEDFLRSPFSKQADLHLDIGDKKYPLQVKGASFPLVIAVNNDGPGYAFDVTVRLKSHISEEGEIEFKSSQVELGGIEPTQALIEFPCSVADSGGMLCAEFDCTWRNFDNSARTTTAILEFKPQRTDVSWEEAETADPYSLSPVASVNELVGRAEILNRLLALTRGSTVESAFIRGQKRVGKTSIVKALRSRLFQLFPQDYAVVYLEAGDYIAHDGKQTIQLLGQAICREVRLADKRFSKITDPDFSAGLAPLNGFLQEALAVIPGCRMLFILDEFDELPLDLYRRGLVGEAFFRTLRSISNKNEFGFVLVGSEKMEYVLSCQGDALNKFERFAVDYFDKHSSWTDFQDLIRKPSAAYLDYSDSAVSQIYDVCAGNPYFAKLVCKALFTSMIRRRDCYVSQREVDAAVIATVAEIGGNSFAHFWQDGISEPPPRSEEISIVRRKVLLSLAECLRGSPRSITGATAEEIVKTANSVQIVDVQTLNELRDFERRQVLVSRDGRFSAKVALFARWLVERGYQEIVTTLVDRETVLRLKSQEELNRVREDEISDLVSKWDLFLGQRIGIDAVRSWLNQFKGNDNQRIAFRFLQAIRFYSADLIRQKMREIHGIVTRQIVWQRRARQPKRRDLIVSAIGGLAHSGAEYARRYADENQIYPDNVVPIDQIPSLLRKSDSEVKAVIFVDDFIGTGETLCKEIRNIPAEIKEVLRDEELLVLLLVVAGYSKGINAVENVISQSSMNISLHVCDTFRSDEALFEEESRAFPSSEERARAKDMAYEYGIQLVQNAPFGYGGIQACVVFENKIPNNCLPILWQQKGAWKPLFKRT